ncbi:hypothetical protein QAD02_015652 [Eretmocerus hayati]|uniref:Uncharacterized protein n=1 Tax=Eretmocerus hayati TaxID=131215 RepID=A0ACC2P8Y3_9HYME|nr:hypothetical protein QAD02_015652 [Eretmocerus hayati]
MSARPASRVSARTAGGRSSASSRSKFPPGEYTIHKPKQCRQLLKNKPIHLKRCTFDGKEVTLALDQNGFRKILVPSTEPTVYPKIIEKTEFEMLMERCYIPTRDEKEKALAAAEKEKDRLLRESMARKESVRKMDLRRSRDKQQGRLTEIEEESRQRTMHLLERARQLKLEQEQEIKKCNKIILETKCRAVRDAQLAEKRLLDRENEAEELRANEIMEAQRVEALREEERRERERSEDTQKFARELKEQIIANELDRQLEFEKKRDEARLSKLSSIAQQEAQLEKLKLEEKKREEARRQLIECNEQLKHLKAMEREEERIMDTRIQAYHRQKAERDARILEEQELENQRKEREKNRVAEQAMQAQDVQAQIDELNASRVTEEVEREWRRREKEEALKKIENLEKLRDSRQKQIERKIQLQAMEMEREKREFEKILALQREALCREEKQREKKKREALKHRSEILRQVNEKEKEKITLRQRNFEEGLAIRAEAEMRNRQLREAMERKCTEMRENRVPDIYIKEVKRLIEHIK